MPCKKIADALATPRAYVKLTGTIDEAIVVNGGRIATFLADPNTTLTRMTGNGPVITVQDDGTSLSVYDVTIHNGPNSPSSIGCLIPQGSGAPMLSLTRVAVSGNAGIGVSTSGGTLVLSRCMIRLNAGGGVAISSSQFDITNSLIVENGSQSSGIGGVDISQILTTGTHRLDFNTIASNPGNINLLLNSGVNCATIATPLTFDSNIIYGNAVNGGGQQFGGDAKCSAIYSDIGPDPAPGATNISSNPVLANPAQGDYHISSSSPAKDMADPNATLGIDFDGDVRPQGPRRDIGADEVR
jgi:hypothetical protein